MTTRLPPSQAFLLPSTHCASERDVEVFQRHLASFVPPDAFDAHAHIYPLETLGIELPSQPHPAPGATVAIDDYRRSTATWMGDRAPRQGLFFGLPSFLCMNVAASNDHVGREVVGSGGSVGLLLARPTDDPGAVESSLRTGGFAGLKVYHTFALRADTPNADVHEYAPPWMWELAHAHGGVIMLHRVKPRTLADPLNQSALRENLRKWNNARLILAHEGRGFCAQHTIDGVLALRGLDNVFFDTSAICEPGALLAVLRQFGSGRSLFGTDFPVSSVRGRCVSVGDGFFWLTDANVNWDESKYGQPTLVGIESLLALRQATTLAGVGDAEVERIFRGNAVELLCSTARISATFSEQRFEAGNVG